MYLIAEQPYYKVQREVSSIDQRDVEYERTIYMYNDKIVTQHREFSIENVLDMSYRVIGQKGGLLYLHTNKGVYSYTVKSSPQQFIDAFKEHVKYN
ncbi:hypothetical protein [Virgibacillus litoralis]|uniref:YcxB family protein n=1 Tax=Virgibacillus litoralis TaxID=578221 RepID=A0ABS4HEQ8_9BACI|nr:hypothetical protein [Virgibacillus litoralis]MBP1949402.1 hypothetical protein [Virgibacillus litoralis]